MKVLFAQEGKRAIFGQNTDCQFHSGETGQQDRLAAWIQTTDCFQDAQAIVVMVVARRPKTNPRWQGDGVQISRFSMHLPNYWPHRRVRPDIRENLAQDLLPGSIIFYHQGANNGRRHSVFP